jgi:ABC-type nitrate/sulfonate/bicarbonate transport system substrate-binding protein
VVASESRIKQKRSSLVRFVKAWNRSARFYKDNPNIMIPYVQRKFAIKDLRIARLLYEEDAQSRVNNGNLDSAARSEVLETAKEIMKVKNPIAANQVFDFSLIEDAR